MMYVVAYVTCTIIIVVLPIAAKAFQINCKVPPSYLKDYHVVSCFVMHSELMMFASVYLSVKATGGVSIMLKMISGHVTPCYLNSKIQLVTSLVHTGHILIS